MATDLLKKSDTPLDEMDELNRKTLSKERFKFGFANVLYQGEEAGLLPIHTVIVRALGGSAVHLGICAAIATAGSLGQWMGAIFLKKFNSNRKAMAVVLWAGAVCAFLVCSFLLFGLIPELKPYILWLYLAFGIALTIITGIQMNIETSWIGDLVPQRIRGWFTSVKYVIGVFGSVCLALLFGKLADARPGFITYASLFVVVAISHIIAVLLIITIRDCTPQNINFISSGKTHHERLNYTSLPLWCYILFFVLWSSGRTAMFAFGTAYMIDHFQYTILKIASILAIQKVISMILLLVMGKASDKYGNRIPLLLISGMVALCMMLWVSSAWWGIVPIIIYQFVNGAAGWTHSMLGINFGLEIFPNKGRAAYFGFSNIIIGICNITVPVIAGKFMLAFEGFRYSLCGVEFSHYHVLFACCSLISFSSIIPLLIAGKRVVPDNAD